MTKRKGFLCVISLFLLWMGTAGLAQAASYTWTDEINFNPDIKVGWFEGYTYTHDITDGPNGFVVGQDKITSYSLTIRLYDDGGRFDCGEIAFVDQPGLGGDGFYYEFSYENEEFGWSVKGIAQLNAEGKLTITILSLFGDFYIDYSRLIANGQDNTAPVPEPSTMLLMGAGLLGTALCRRFMKKKQ